MLYNRVEYDGWIIHFTICVDLCNCVMFDILDDIGASSDIIENVRHDIYYNHNTGFTYTNYDIKEILVVIAVLDSITELINTTVHEIRHVVDNICYYNKINDKETPAYMTADLTVKLIGL